MLLRRISKHVNDQNWFAVGIDFFIVVVGVFLGIQIGNWNEARASKVQEGEYLVQLREEVLANADMARIQATYVDNVIAGGRKGLSFLEGDEICETDCEDIIIAFFHASQVWGTGFFEAKYEETNRLGIPSDELLRLKVLDFYSLISGWGTVNSTPPPYRERVRGLISVDAMDELWRNCYEITDNANQILLSDCADDLSKLDLTSSLERLRNDGELADLLRYWVSQNEFAANNYPIIISRSEATAKAIDNHLNRSR